MTRAIVTVTVASIFLVALQVAWISPLRISGVVVMVVWLWPLSLGLTGVTSVAVVGGIISGLLFDAQTSAPFGTTAIVGALLAYLISILAREGVGDLDGTNWIVPAGLMALGGLVAPILYVGVAALFGHPSLWRDSLIATMLVNFVAFFILSRPLARVTQRLARSGGWARS